MYTYSGIDGLILRRVWKAENQRTFVVDKNPFLFVHLEISI